MARIVEVIRHVETVGKGIPEDPMRYEATYWTKDGQLIARMDVNDDPLWPYERLRIPSESSSTQHQ